MSSTSSLFYRNVTPTVLDIPVEFDSDEKVIAAWVDCDTEFQASMNRPNIPITTQLRVNKGDVVIFEHPELGLGLNPVWTGETSLERLFNLKGRYVPEKPSPRARRLVVHWGFFFSFSDIAQNFIRETVRKQIADNVKQQSRICSDNERSTPVYTGLHLEDQNGFSRALFLQPQDTSALAGKTSLQSLAETLGVKMEDKSLLTQQDKENMLETYKNKQEAFRLYATGDVVIRELFEKSQDLHTSIAADLNIPQYRAKGTLGANVATISTLLVSDYLEKNKGLLEASESRVEDIPEEVFGTKVKTTAQLVQALGVEGTAKNLAQEKSNTKYLLAMVDGGRCKNERPRDTRVDGLVVDIDISGCYGNGLMNQVYPVGRPCFMSFDKTRTSGKRDDRPVLDVLTKGKLSKELVSGLWYARVSTTEPLSFCQDALMSKEPPKSFQERTESTDDLLAHESNEVLGTFVLLSKELRSAPMTSDLLQVLQATLSNQEWSEFCSKVVVDSLMFYPKSLEVQTLTQLVDAIVKEDKGVHTKLNKSFGQNTSDKRSHHWVSVPMGEGWVDKLLGLRKNYPKGDVLNNAYKLVINATYGVLASVHFDIGNVVVANNITARARALAWMMAKAFGSYQSITDGGTFNINQVNFRNDTQPSCNTLHYINETQSLTRRASSSVRTAPLGGHPWSLKKVEDGQTVLQFGSQEVRGHKEAWTELDELAWNHLKAFFPGDIDILNKPGWKVKGYNKETREVLKVPTEGLFSFETKDVYIAAGFQSQANYILQDVSGKKSVKARGYETRKTLYCDPFGQTKYDQEPPINVALEAILEGRDVPALAKTYNSTVLKVNAYKQPNWLVKENNLLPGDTTSRSSHVRPVSLSMFRFQTWEQLEAWTKRHSRLKDERGYGLELYFMNPDGSVRYQEAVNSIQDRLDAGHFWLEDVRKHDVEGHHPFFVLERP